MDILLIADLVVKKRRQRRAAGRKRLRWWKIKDEETKEKFPRNLVEGQRLRRKQGWKAGGGMMRRRARLGRRKKD